MNNRLEPLIHRRVIYTVTDQDGIYAGVEKSRKMLHKFLFLFL